MLRRTLITGTTVLGGLAFAPWLHAAPSVGQRAPDFSLVDTGGKTVRLSDFQGKHVVLEWVNPGCPYVRKHYGSNNMQSTQNDVVASGIVWLAINSTEEASSDYQTPEQLARWMQEQKAAATHTLMDPEGTAGKAYGARTTPHMYIVDPRGALVYAGGIDSIPSSRVGDIKTAVNYVRQGVRELLAGQPVSAATTRPYGCSIKYRT
jgi:peroxiredoxin